MTQSLNSQNTDLCPDTRLIKAGHDISRNQGMVNCPVYRGSTVAFSSISDMETALARRKTGARTLVYGRVGSPTQWALEDAISELEGAAGTLLTSSGLSACTSSILAIARQGQHILVSDSAYEPTKQFCEVVLPRYGIEVSYYPPSARVEKYFRPNTIAVFCESPGSHTFEIQDIPAIAAVARTKDAFVIVDNTWASPMFCRPLSLGADISIQAATKYIVGHSDALLGTVSANERVFSEVAKFHLSFGLHASPDDAYLALRGLRTMGVRLERHYHNALIVAQWLANQPQVSRVLFPALETSPDYELWKRDFTGASGLMGVTFKGANRSRINALIDALGLFTIGLSWGGYESLVCPSDPAEHRSAAPWPEPTPGLRLHIGLEDPSDLINDLRNGLKRFEETAE